MMTKTQEQILMWLVKNPQEKATIRGIARKLGKSYALVYNNLLELERKEIIIKQPVPPAQIISLNEHAPLELFVDIEFKIKDNFLQKHSWAKLMLKDVLRNISTPFFILMVFGSYAKGSQDEKSDLDLLMVVNEKKEIKDAEKAMQNIYTKVKKSIHAVDLGNFREMLQNPGKLSIGNEAKKHHILLYGIEEYHQIIKNL